MLYFPSRSLVLPNAPSFFRVRLNANKTSFSKLQSSDSISSFLVLKENADWISYPPWCPDRECPGGNFPSEALPLLVGKILCRIVLVDRKDLHEFLWLFHLLSALHRLECPKGSRCICINRPFQQTPWHSCCTQGHLTIGVKSGSIFVACQNFHAPQLNEGLFHLFQAHRPWCCLESVPSRQQGVVGFGLCTAK